MRHGLAVWCMFLAGAVFTQQGIAKETDGEYSDTVVRTEHFEIHLDSGVCPTDARTLALEMEGRFAAYNQIFRFDVRRLDGPLRVRAFGNRQRYESYVGSRLGGDVPPGAVYLHFAQTEMRELVIHLGSEAEILPFQAFIQFLRAFIPNPPVWVRDGFAIHFATLDFVVDGEGKGTPVHRENLVWLDVIRGIPELPSPETIMQTTSPASVDNFPGLAWSLVSFFLNSGNDNYRRSLTESFMMLSYRNSTEENTAAMVSRIAMWNSMGDIARDHRIYLDSLSSFSELIAAGQYAYNAGRAADAEAAFRGALEIRPDHYAPWYYLGLLAYNDNNTEAAERYYRIALGFGADTASVLYALALNAAIAGRTAEAMELLRQASATAPDRFGERAEILIEQLESIRVR
ncbi:MAG: tetratricopeptide repeat protein [Treponema sp.]|nr:tetratricopeptide repeat protein [Treponema sp.]